MNIFRFKGNIMFQNINNTIFNLITVVFIIFLGALIKNLCYFVDLLYILTRKMRCGYDI